MRELLELPAYARSLGVVVHGEEAGMPVLTVDFGPTVEGRPQHFHGGATAGLLENAGYAALRTALLAAGRDPQLKPINITVQYLAAGYAALRTALLADGRNPQLKPINITVQYLAAGKSKPSFAIGRITRLGRRNANVTVEAWQDDRSRPIATAVMNILMV